MGTSKGTDDLTNYVKSMVEEGDKVDIDTKEETPPSKKVDDDNSGKSERSDPPSPKPGPIFIADNQDWLIPNSSQERTSKFQKWYERVCVFGIEPDFVKLLWELVEKTAEIE